MRVVVISNFYNHHQSSLAEAFRKIDDIDYYFIATEKVPEDRVAMGYSDDDTVPEFVIKAYNEETMAKKLVAESDIVISSWDGKELLKNRNQQEKLTFVYSERIFKNYEGEGVKADIKNRLRRVKYKNYISGYTAEKTQFLCIGQGAMDDYGSLGVDEGVMHKFAYYPRLSLYPKKSYKLGETINILWCGRLLGWKCPLSAVHAVGMLIMDGYDVKLTVVGDGEEKGKIAKFVQDKNLEDRIILERFKTPAEIRKLMNEQDIFLFTSTAAEGWGVTLHEAMSEGMAVVAAIEPGASTFLLSDGGGIKYHADSETELYLAIKRILDEPSLIEKYGTEAREIIESKWHAEAAVDEILKIYNETNQ